jgi:hypothetical protein
VTCVVDTESGEMLQSMFPMIQSNDPQKIGSCISYGKRYNIGQIFNIITDRDDDGNEASKPEKAVFTEERFEKLVQYALDNPKKDIKGMVEKVLNEETVSKVLREKLVLFITPKNG